MLLQSDIFKLQFGLIADICDKQVDAAAALNGIAPSHNSLLGGALATVSVLANSCFSGGFSESISRSAGAVSPCCTCATCCAALCLAAWKASWRVVCDEVNVWMSWLLAYAVVLSTKNKHCLRPCRSPQHPTPRGRGERGVGEGWRGSQRPRPLAHRVPLVPGDCVDADRVSETEGGTTRRCAALAHRTIHPPCLLPAGP